MAWDAPYILAAASPWAGFMISLFRRYLDSWLVRGFFILMIVAFVGWGISGSLTQLVGPPTWVAKVGGETIEIPAFQAQFQRALAQQSRNLPAGQEPTADERRAVGQQTLQRMIAQAALAVELRNLHIVTPDEAVAEAARAMPAFRGSDGAFSKPVFDTVLRNNGYTETRFLAELRADIAQRQLLSAIDGAATAPAAEVKPLYNAEFEKRSADMAVFPLSAAPEPPAPDEAVLQRWYDNHPDSYTTPEFRRIKAVELSPQSLASEINVTDDDLRAEYEARKAQFTTAERRSAQVISAPDEAKAKALAERWRGTPDWAAMQAAATADGASALSQDDATRVQFPDPDLAKAVFAASADTVSDPVKGALGWFVVKVTKITPGSETSFEAAKDGLRAALLASKAAGLIYDRANKVDGLLGNGTSLEDMPADLGLAGVAGTLDSAGLTQAGTPAPIPGPAELKAAIIAAAFQASPGDPPRLTEVPTPSIGGSSYYALTVETVIPPGKKPFDDVKSQVTQDWVQDQRRRAQDKAATAMMTAVQGGQSFSEAATVAGVTPHVSAPVTRNQGGADMPPTLQRVLFGMKMHDATMVETPDGFVVAQLVEILPPDPAADKTGYDQARDAITRSIQADLATVFIDAVRLRADPRTNQSAFDSVVQSR
jgi:peptidyl-prolyl cis-trans isomerase D